MDLERLTERKNARQQLYIGLTRAVRLAIVLEPDIAVSQLATLLERAAACINAASTHQDFKKNIPVRPVKLPAVAAEPKPTIQKTEPAPEPPVDVVTPPFLDPDIILVGADTNGRPYPLTGPLRALRAARENRIQCIPGGNLGRPTLRTSAGVIELARIIHRGK